MRGLIESGHKDEEKLEALTEFREWLLELRENDQNRLPVRRDGRSRFRPDGTRVYGPFAPRVRRNILSRLIALQQEIGEPLISNAEIVIIQDVWRRDDAREQGRHALLATVNQELETVSS